ncbi:hypothetical protein [Nocardia neocaledoniensis]|uniref:hypothetical protein n=1 Tax=Nocardia neocaledoniensis TaxID=236511 RepID=UPI00245739BA|nr:hypothetical protein [Nocardia neocaledoniensis]
MTSDDAESKKDDATADKPDLAKSAPTVKGAAATPEDDAATVKAATVSEAAAAPAAEPAGKSSSTGWIAAGVAGVVALGAATAAVVFFLQSNDKADKLDAIAESTKAACDYGNILANYDYSQNLDGYIEQMKAGATGDYLKEFSDASDALKGAMVQAQVKSRGEDVQCAYVSGSTEDVKSMVTMTQYRTNFTQTEPDRMMFAIEMTLEKSGDKWLVSKLDSPLLKNGSQGQAGAGAVPGGQPAPTQEAPAPAPAPGN